MLNCAGRELTKRRNPSDICLRAASVTWRPQRPRNSDSSRTMMLSVISSPLKLPRGAYIAVGGLCIFQSSAA